MKSKNFTNTVELITSECLAVRMRILNRTVTKIFDNALRPLGVKVSQLNVLMVVARYGPISPSNITRRLNIEKSTLSRNIERMLTHGWLKVSHGESGHTQVVALGSPGRKLIEKSLPLWKTAQEQSIALLGQRGVRSIHQAADTVWAKLGRKT